MPYKIPENLEPEGVQCIRIYVPNDVEWRSLFWGTFSELARWFNYEKDGTEHGAQVARLWRTLYLQSETEFIEGGGCGLMDVRVKPDDDCILQKSADGETWEDWANLDDCGVKTRINPETCLYEVDCGDGNWQPVKTSAYDPRFDDVVPDPYPDDSLPEGQDAACVAAANAASYFDYASLGYANAIGGGGVLGAICAAIMSYVSAIQQVVFSIVLERVAIDFAFYNTATIVADQAGFDWDDLKNLLVCYYDNHGNASKEEYTTLQEQIQSRFDDSQIWRVVYSIISMIGPIGLTNVAKWGGITEADCDSCGGGCMVTFDGGSMPYTFWNGHGTVETGAGIDGSDCGHSDVFYTTVWNTGVFVKIPLAPGTLDNIYLQYQIIDPIGSTAPTGISVSLFDGDDNALGAHNNAGVTPVSIWTPFTVAEGLGWTILEGYYIMIDVSEVWYGYGGYAAEAVTRVDNIVIEGEGIC